MDAQVFWKVIGNYNNATWTAQYILFALIIAGVVLAYFGKAIWLPKFALGAANLFIGTVFFLVYGSEPIQTYFAAPLFISAGLLFLWEAANFTCSAFSRFSRMQWILLCMVALYPLVSLLLGRSFPQIVTNVMPCPIISLSIVIYACYEHQNKILLALMAIWGLTGVKAFFFNALEDVILLICGVYCLFTLVRQIRAK
jgi:hypothetical protein